MEITLASAVATGYDKPHECRPRAVVNRTIA
jgi:hypothetical protein